MAFLQSQRKSWEEASPISTETWCTQAVLHFSPFAPTVFPVIAVLCRLEGALQLSTHTDKDPLWQRQWKGKSDT